MPCSEESVENLKKRNIAVWPQSSCPTFTDLWACARMVFRFSKVATSYFNGGWRSIYAKETTPSYMVWPNQVKQVLSIITSSTWVSVNFQFTPPGMRQRTSSRPGFLLWQQIHQECSTAAVGQYSLSLIIYVIYPLLYIWATHYYMSYPLLYEGLPIIIILYIYVL